MALSRFVAGLISLVGASTPPPVVLWHGWGDHCCGLHGAGDASAGNIKNLLQNQINGIEGVFVHSIMIGNSEEEDLLQSISGNLNVQVDEVCNKLKKEPQLANGFNAVGIGQGGLLMRAYVQRCNDPPVKKLITIGAPHQGIAAGIEQAPLPLCEPYHRLCHDVEKWRQNPYSASAQQNLVQAQYFKDPMAREKYEVSNIFLPDINNELMQKNKTYKNNLITLEKLVLIRFGENDFEIKPHNSSWFSRLSWGSHPTQMVSPDRMLNMEDTDNYQDDWIGLKTLDEQGKIDMKTCPARAMTDLTREGACLIELKLEQYLS